MNVCVIGSEGYVGRPLCRELVARGHTVFRLDLLLRGYRAAPEEEAGAFIKTSRIALLALKKAKPDVVVDLAAHAHDPEGKLDRTLVAYNNAWSVNDVFQAMRHHQVRYIVPSSLSVFSSEGAYPESKRELERLLFARGFEPLLSVVRFGTLFGVYDTHSAYEKDSFRPHLLLNKMAKDALEKGYVGAAEGLSRPVCSLGTAVDVLVNLVERPGPHGELRNVFEAQGTVREFGEWVASELRAELKLVGSKDSRSYSWGAFKPEKIKTEFGRLKEWLLKHGG